MVSFFDSVLSSFSGTGYRNFGIGIVNKGFLVLIINVVVAMYKGIAASNNITNTKPGKLFRLAWGNCAQAFDENMSKLNSQSNIPHITAP